MLRVVRDKFKSKTQAEWLAQLGPVDICFGPVNTVAEAFADPQVQARGMIREINGLKLIASPLKFSNTAPVEPTPPPEFGQHTAEVLRSLGYSASAVDQLRAARVV
jgi:formyl-CoA transferase